MFYFSTGFVTVTTTKPVIVMHIGKINITHHVDGGRGALSTGKMNQFGGGGALHTGKTN